MKKSIMIGLLQMCLASVLNAQWLQLPFPVTSDLRGVAFCNADTGFVVTNNTIYRTTDGGESWLLSATSPYQLYDVCVPKFSKKTVYAVGGFLSFDFSGNQEVHSIVLKTTDFGGSWQSSVDNGSLGLSRLEYCYFPNDSIGFVMGSSGPYIPNSTPKKTTNGGLTWIEVSGIGDAVYTGGNIDFVTDSIAYKSDGYGSIVKTTNQGDTWSYITTRNIREISFLDVHEGYAGSVVIFKTTSDGVSWIPIDTVSQGNNMQFSSINIGYVINLTGQVFKTINGQKFNSQTTPTTNSLARITLVKNDTLYIVGNTGTLLKTTNGGMLSSATELPKTAAEFRLEQNYPNPFNPSTAIKFSLSKASQTSLVIYDVLGRQVSELVNEKKPAGNYEVKFDASRLASGIYFYRLATSSFSQTRKMILIK